MCAAVCLIYINGARGGGRFQRKRCDYREQKPTDDLTVQKKRKVNCLENKISKQARNKKERKEHRRKNASDSKRREIT